MKNPLIKNKQFSLFLYKISTDILILLLTFFCLAFLADSILPGIISDHISFLKFFFIITATTLLVTYLGMKNEITYSPAKSKRKKVLFAFLSIFFVLSLLVSLRKFFPIEITVIGITSIAIVFYFYKTLIHET
ncbi:MAG: hypothetical protein OEV93_04085 [Candidatus Moranbacteria bacterium]|nr:hypothetical protein [Candidatus Moranbacteria bacterium]